MLTASASNTLLIDKAKLGMTAERGVKNMIMIAVEETATGIARSVRIVTEIAGTMTEGTVVIHARVIGMPAGRGMMTGTGRGMKTAIEIEGETFATMTIAGPPKRTIGRGGEKIEDMIPATAIAGNCIRYKHQCAAAYDDTNV